MSGLIPVNILIGDRTYRVKIAPADEESVRRTTKTINDKVLEFKTQFAGKDMQDYIAMVLVWYATEMTRVPAESFPETDLPEKLDAIERMVDAALAKSS